MFKTATIDKEVLNISVIHDLTNKYIDLVIVEKVISYQDSKILIDAFLSFDAQKKTIRISEDGCFYPVPYSLVSNLFFEQPEKRYFDLAEDFNLSVQENGKGSVKLTNFLSSIGLKEMPPFMQQNYASLNIRLLNSHMNGIDLHCENSFIELLTTEFNNSLYERVDLENILSFYIVLQKPEKGGELILYNREWKEKTREMKRLCK